ncbi:MAG: pyridoxamine 5'-phosphate oxidase family protein [Pyrinomonadaceae bacterium]
MIEVKDMTPKEVEDLLGRVNYGHLGCSSNNHPYVLPIHFAYDEHTIYIYTTEGKKSEMIDSNPEICLQVEEVVDNENWASVIVIGEASRLLSAADREEAYACIAATNPTLTPAISYRWLDNWVRENKDIEVVYRINRKSTSGRRAGEVRSL